MTSDTWPDEVAQGLPEEVRSAFSQRALQHLQHPHNFEPGEASDVHGCLKGSCGDIMVIWLRAEGDRIARAGFLTDGCGSSIMCGSSAAMLVEGCTWEEARTICPGRVIDELGGLPREAHHCAELACDALHKALHDLAARR